MSQKLTSCAVASGTSRAATAPQRRNGFTLIELMVVLAIVAVATAMAVPSMSVWSSNQKLQDAAGLVETTLAHARGEAVKTGNIHLVFFGADTAGNALVTEDGVTVQMLIVDDGLPGSANQNCLIDAGEAGEGFMVDAIVNLGATNATAKVPEDTGAGVYTTGFTFLDAGGAAASWVMFRPDGTTRAFSNDCSQDVIGSGSGAVYITNGSRDLATVLTPLGSSRVRSWDEAAGAWSN